MFLKIFLRQHIISARTMSNNCIVIHASCGEGHKKAAVALSGHFGLECFDFLDFSHSWIRTLYSQGYRFAVKNLPLFWSFLFWSAKINIIKLVINRLHLYLFSSFLAFLRRRRPQVIIVTHFFPIYLIKTLKDEIDTRLVVVVTDLGVHPLWLDSRVDDYLVALDCTKEELIEKGIDSRKIEVTGLPLRDGFRKPIDAGQIRKRIGLDQKPAILVLSSTEGNICFLSSMVEELSADFNLIVIYGHNKKTERYLLGLNNPSVKPFLYYENIWELMEVSCLIITKPGGLTISEALFKRKPLIFTHFIRGQEKRNMDIIVQKGLGFYVTSFSRLKEIIYSLTSRQSLYKDFKLPSKDVFLALDGIIDSHE